MKFQKQIGSYTYDEAGETKQIKDHSALYAIITPEGSLAGITNKPAELEAIGYNDTNLISTQGYADYLILQGKNISDSLQSNVPVISSINWIPEYNAAFTAPEYQVQISDALALENENKNKQGWYAQDVRFDSEYNSKISYQKSVYPQFDKFDYPLTFGMITNDTYLQSLNLNSNFKDNSATSNEVLLFSGAFTDAKIQNKAIMLARHAGGIEQSSEDMIGQMTFPNSGVGHLIFLQEKNKNYNDLTRDSNDVSVNEYIFELIRNPPATESYSFLKTAPTLESVKIHEDNPSRLVLYFSESIVDENDLSVGFTIFVDGIERNIQTSQIHWTDDKRILLNLEGRIYSDNSIQIIYKSALGLIKDVQGDELITTNLSSGNGSVIENYTTSLDPANMDTQAPTIGVSATPISEFTNDSTPDFSFSSDEEGLISYSGGCSSASDTAIAANNTITLDVLIDGTYSNCTITVTDAAGNTSNALLIPSFTVDTLPPTLNEVTPIVITNTSTPKYTFNSSESGSIGYSGSCSSIDIEALGGDNTINLDPLSDGIYSNCSITLTDPAGNSSDPLTIPTFTIDTTPPVLTEVQAISTPTSNNTPVYSFQSTESGTISYSGACSSTSLSANEGMNTINLGPLVDSTYSNCEINLTDQAGNISTGLTLSSFTIDTTVPQMLNAVVYEGSNANRIALSVSEAVTGVNGSSELSVTVNGQATSILSVEKHPVDSTKIWITLTRRVYAGEAITIIHTASGMIKDEAGNQLTDGQIAVTNSTTTPVDPTPEMQSAVVYEGLIFPTKSRHRIKHASAGTPAHTH